jgi:NADH dehydrogenase
MMATIGRAAAIAQFRGFKFKGFFAWLAWCFVHILYLISFRNKVLVLVQWMWSYLRFGRGARLITQREWRMGLPGPDADGDPVPQSSSAEGIEAE